MTSGEIGKEHICCHFSKNCSFVPRHAEDRRPRHSRQGGPGTHTVPGSSPRSASEGNASNQRHNETEGQKEGS